MYSSRCLLLTCLVLLSVAFSCNEPQESVLFSKHQSPWEQSEPEALTGASEELPPDINARTFMAAGIMFEEKGNIPHAILNYNRAITVDPTYAEAYNSFGKLLGRIGQHEDAMKMLRRALALRPNSSVIHNNIGYQYCLKGRWVEAEDMLRKALQLDPDYERAMINLGVALCRMGNYDEGLAEFEKVLDQPDAYYNLGLMYKADKDYGRATEAFRLALALEPRMSAAEKQLETLAEKLKQRHSVLPPTESVDEIVVASVMSDSTKKTLPEAQPMYGPAIELDEAHEAVVKSNGDESPESVKAVEADSTGSNSPELSSDEDSIEIAYDENGMSLLGPDDIVDDTILTVVEEPAIVEMAQPDAVLDPDEQGEDDAIVTIAQEQPAQMALEETAVAVNAIPIEDWAYLNDASEWLADVLTLSWAREVDEFWMRSAQASEVRTPAIGFASDNQYAFESFEAYESYAGVWLGSISETCRHQSKKTQDIYHSVQNALVVTSESMFVSSPVDHRIMQKPFSAKVVIEDATWSLLQVVCEGPVSPTVPDEKIFADAKIEDQITPESYWAMIHASENDGLSIESIVATSMDMFIVPVLDSHGVRFAPIMNAPTESSDVSQEPKLASGEMQRIPSEFKLHFKRRTVGGYVDRTLEPVDLTAIIACTD